MAIVIHHDIDGFDGNKFADSELDIEIGIFQSQTRIDASINGEQPMACIGIAPDLDNISVTCDYIFQNPDDITEYDILLAHNRRFGIPMHIHDFGDYYLRELCLEDIDDLIDLYESPGFTDYMDELYDRPEEIEYQRNYIRNIYGLYGYGMWLLYEKRELQEDQTKDKLIGRFGIETRETCLDDNQVEIGYSIRSDYRNKGIASMVCQWILEYAFFTIDKTSVIARVNRENMASIRLAIKLGMRLMSCEDATRVDNSVAADASVAEMNVGDTGVAEKNIDDAGVAEKNIDDATYIIRREEYEARYHG